MTLPEYPEHGGNTRQVTHEPGKFCDGCQRKTERGGSCYGSGPQSQREFSHLARSVKCVRESGQGVDDAQKRAVSGRIFCPCDKKSA